jgi:hypothetical protein
MIMMTAKAIDFFTPVCDGTWKDKVERYFFLGGKIVDVIDSKCFSGTILVAKRKEKETTVRKAMKIASYIFGCLLLFVKLAIRATHRYRIVKPNELLAEIDRIKASPIPAEKASQRLHKKNLLATAYTLCMRKIQASEKKETPAKELALTLGEILSKYAPLITEDKEVSKQLLLGSLKMQLYAAGAVKSCDLAALPKDLRELPEKWVGEMPFQSVESDFSALGTDELYQKIDECSFSAHERVVLSQTLRHLKIGGALAEKCVSNDRDMEMLRELWELRFADEQQSHRDWLYAAAKKMPQTYLQDIGRLTCKLAKTVDDYKSTLELAKTALLPQLSVDTYADLENILDHNKHDSATIAKVAHKLMHLDPKRTQLNIAWLAILLSQLGYAMMRDNPQDLEAPKGLLYLSKEIVDVYKAQNVEMEELEGVIDHYVLLHLLNSAKGMLRCLEEEKKKVEAAKKVNPLTQLEIERLAVSVTQVKKRLCILLKPLEARYAEEVATARKLQNDALKKFEQLKKVALAIRQEPSEAQKEAMNELDKVAKLLDRSSDFVTKLLDKVQK